MKSKGTYSLRAKEADEIMAFKHLNLDFEGCILLRWIVTRYELACEQYKGLLKANEDQVQPTYFFAANAKPRVLSCWCFIGGEIEGERGDCSKR